MFSEFRSEPSTRCTVGPVVEKGRGNLELYITAWAGRSVDPKAFLDRGKIHPGGSHEEGQGRLRRLRRNATSYGEAVKLARYAEERGLWGAVA